MVYDAGANLVPDTNCKKEDIKWSINEPSEGATIDASGVVTFGAEGALITVVVKCGELTDSMSLLYLRLTTQTVARVPSPRSRRLLGVGEEDNISVTPLTGTVAWRLEGPGALSFTSHTAKFEAGDVASEATVFATLTASSGQPSATCSVKFTVIPPSDVEMVRLPGKPEYHEQDRPSAGVCTQVYILPRTVCFYRISIREGECWAVASGYFESENGAYHGRGSSFAVKENTEANPSLGDANDNVGFRGGFLTVPPYGPWPLRRGSIEWKIPYEYVVTTGVQLFREFTIVSQAGEATEQGNLAVRKAGVTVTKDYGEASSGRWRPCE